MKVEITEEHIQRGRSYSCMFCPGALAINDALGLDGKSEFALVDKVYTYFKMIDCPGRLPEYVDIIHTPAELKAFTEAFDHVSGRKTKGVVFEIPDSVLESFEEARKP